MTIDTILKLMFIRGTSSKRGITFVNGHQHINRVSYAELFTNAYKLLNSFRHQGATPRSHVIISLLDNELLLTAFWACILGELIPIPISQGISEDHHKKFQHLLRDLPDPFLITDQKHANRLIELVANDSYSLHVIENRRLYLEGREAETLPSVPQHLPSDIAFLQYSSGSTNNPKGITLTHENLIANVSAIAERSKITGFDCSLSWMPLHHDMGMICFHLTSLYSDIDQVLVPTDLFVRRPLLWLETIQRTQASLIYSPNFGLRYLLQALENNSIDNYFDLSSVRLLYNGAENISHEICFRFQEKLKKYRLKEHIVFPGYGLAEGSVAVTLPIPNEPLRTYCVDRSTLNIGRRIKVLPIESDNPVFVEVGFAVQYCEVRICNDNNELLPDSYVGHIQILGKNVTKGYYNNASATAQVFTPDGWLKTGDVGFLVGQRLVITGRSKQMIIVNGQNYFPQDIELVVIKCDPLFDFGKVVACGVTVDQTEALIIFILFKGSLDLFIPYAELIQSKVVEKVGVRPLYVFPVKKIPKTTSGKIQHFKLVQDFLNGEFSDAIEHFHKNEVPAHNEDSVLQVVSLLENNSSSQGNQGESLSLLIKNLSSLEKIRLISTLNDKFGFDLVPGDSLEQKVHEFLSHGQVTVSNQNVLQFEDQEHYSLAKAQRRLYFLQLLRGDSALNVVTGRTMKGDLNIPDLISAINNLAEVYPLLKCGFRIVEQEPRLFHRPDFITQLQHVDIQEAKNPASKIDEIVEEQAGKQFAMATDPLIRFTLIQYRSNDFHLVMIVHHIIADGWSTELIWKKLFQLYDGHPSKMVSGGFSMAARRKETAESLSYQQSARYWRNRIDGVSSLKFNLTESASSKFNTYRFSTEEKVYDRLKHFYKKKDLSLHAVLQAAFNLVFFKFSRTKDFLLTTEFVNRWTQNNFEQIGYYINSLPIPAKVNTSDSFQDYASRFHKSFMADLKHGQYEVDDLSEMDGIPSLIDLMQVLFIFQDFGELDTLVNTKGRLSISRFIPRHTQSLVPLQIECYPSGSQLQYAVHYDTGKYSEGFVSTLIETFQSLISQVVESPQESCAVHIAQNSSPYLKQIEDQQPAELVITELERVIRRFPDHIAITFEQTSISYSVLWEKSLYIARHLKNRVDIQPGHLVGLHVDRSHHLIIAMVGIMRTGAGFVTVDTTYPEFRKKQIFDDARPKIIISDSFIETDVEAVMLRDMLEEIEGDGHWPFIPEEIAYVNYTSGTTGKPKGVMISHYSLSSYVHAFADFFKINVTDRILQQASVGFDTFLEEVFPVLCLGGNVVVSKSVGADIEALIDLIQNKWITIVSATPLIIAELNKGQLSAMQSLRSIISGGDSLKPTHIDRLLSETEIYNTYGPTETTICATFHRVKDLSDVSCIGRPIRNTSVYIVDDELKQVGPYITGELVIGGDKLSAGYRNQKLLTDKRFILWHNGEAIERVYLSGDRGYRNRDGEIIFLGRTDNQVKINGYRIEKEDVEMAMLRYPDVVEARCIATTNESGAPYLVGFALTNVNGLEVELRSFLYQHLPKFMVPSRVVCVKSWPQTAHGKIDIQKLLSYESVLHPLDDILTDTESSLIKIWRDVLGITPTNTNQDFFRMGGNSISAVRIANDINHRFNTELVMGDIFNNSTIKMLSRLVETSARSFSLLQKNPSQVVFQTSHAQRRLWFINQYRPDSYAYHLQSVGKLTGNLEVQTFSLSLAELIQRHDILRTVFLYESGELHQQLKNIKLNDVFDYIDLSESNTAKHAIEKQFFESELSLKDGPLWKIRIIHDGPEQYTILFNVHHIIFDLHSTAIFITELFNRYSRRIKGEMDNDIDIIFQYHDYAVWEAKYLEQHHQRMSTYWKNKLNEIPEPIQFGKVFNSSVASKDNDSIRISFTQTLTDRLDDFCKNNGYSRYACLMVGLGLVLRSTSKRNSFLIGTSVSTRAHKMFEYQIGLFINQLPIHVKIIDTQTLKEQMDAMHTEIVSSFNHKMYPLDLIKRDCLQKGWTEENDLFNVMLDVGLPDEQYNPDQLGEAISLHVYPLQARDKKFDVAMQFSESGILQGLVHFDKSKYQYQDMEAIVTRFKTAMDFFGSEVNSTVAEIVNGIDQRIISSHLATRKVSKAEKIIAFQKSIKF